MPDLERPDIDQELSHRLGQIVIRWSTIEYLLGMLLGTLLNADQAGMMIVTNNVSVSTQCKWLRALMSAHEHEEQESRRVIQLLDRADDLRSERNEIVHGIWSNEGCQPRTALVQTVNLDRSEIIKTRLVTVQDLDDLRVDIQEWIDDYIALGRELSFPRHRGQTASIFA
jgi:hypothetical protein